MERKFSIFIFTAKKGLFYGRHSTFSHLMIKNGLLTKGVGGLYNVLTEENTYTCTARGSFRNKKITPLAGDRVEISIEDEQTATITSIQPRKNTLLRPAMANIDQIIVTLSAAQPAFNPGLLDRFLILAAQAKINAVICINKCDIYEAEKGASAMDDPLFIPYRMAGYPLIFVSAKQKTGLYPLREIMAGKLSVFAGVSGVGKSSLINRLLPHAAQEIGEMSTKLKRGKHTTRTVEILPLGITAEEGFLADTPGFSSLTIEAIPPRDMASYFIEFVPFITHCKFNNCLHHKESDCAVKAQVGLSIHPLRYESYIKLISSPSAPSAAYPQ
jgi:ribosome biogenesis GTPase